MTDTLQKRSILAGPMLRPMFVTANAQPGNVIPALARLLIDRLQGDLTN